MQKNHERLQKQHDACFCGISLNTMTATQQIPEGTLCCHHLLTGCLNHSVGRCFLVLSDYCQSDWIILNYLGMLLWDAAHVEAPIWRFCYTFAQTDQDRKRNIWKNQVFYFFSNQESWQARQFWFCEICSSLYSEVAWFNARHLGREKGASKVTTRLFFFLLLKTKSGRVKALILFIGIC